MKTKALLLLVLAFTFHVSFAQLCTGSLGDPVVNITFGTGAGIGSPLSTKTTSYNFVTDNCPADGNYTITSNTVDCFGASWHTLNEDHTPNDVDGRFMLINASFVPGDFYVDTIRGLCPNTSYEFAAWVKNVLKPTACSGTGIQPNLTFKVESITGTVLTIVNSGDIPNESNAAWKQYGAFFQTAATGITDVVIRLTNNAPGGCGNDLALDDITFRPCGPQINASVGPTNLSSIYACDNEKKDYMLSASFSPGVYANPSFQWQVSSDAINWTDIPGATNNSYLRTVTPMGVYYYRMLIADGANINLITCRLASNSVKITVTQANALVTPLATGCEKHDINLTASGGITFLWTGPNGYQSNSRDAIISKARLIDAGWYKVRVTDTTGCWDEDSINVTVNPSPTANAGTDISICEGSFANLNGSGGIKYLWTPSTTLSNDTIANPVAQPIDTTKYLLTVTNGFNCTDTSSVTVNIWKKPTANAGPDKKTMKGYPVTIEGLITGSDIRFYWTPSTGLINASLLKTQANPTASTTYTLHAESLHGCGVATDIMFVKVYDRIVVPNAFSPNGDGINDTWVIEPLDIFANSSTKVYNRYGQLVYSSKGYSKPWDGTKNGSPLPVGTYYYIIDLNIDAEPVLNGALLIIR